MHRPDWVPDSVDIERPSVARMYDYYLGGSHNFAVDREAARQVIAAVPEAPLMAQANRAFLRRVVRFMIDSGIRQFLDIGSGIPTVGNVHEIAQGVAPDARVVYVDCDPVAVAQTQEILAHNDRAVAIQEDLRRPDRILFHPATRRLLDFNRPVGVLVIAVLHFVSPADDPAGIFAALRAGLTPGSFLALSQAAADGRQGEWRHAQEVYRSIDNAAIVRSHAEFAQLFDGFDLVEPGVVWVGAWRPDCPEAAMGADRGGFVCGVGRRGE